MYHRILVSMPLVLGLAACGTDRQETVNFDAPSDTLGAPAPAGMSQATRAGRATFHDAAGQEIGTASLTQNGDAVTVQLRLTALEPGEHGFHFHQVGACDPPGFDSAGGHFNPTDAAHGFDHPDGPHAGDMRNLVVGADGTVTTTVSNVLVSLHEGHPSALFDGDGTALIIHSGPDDYRTQPSGDSGDPVACAVLEPA